MSNRIHADEQRDERMCLHTMNIPERNEIIIALQFRASKFMLNTDYKHVTST